METSISETDRKDTSEMKTTNKLSAFATWKASAEPRMSWFLLFFSVLPINILLGFDIVMHGIFSVEYAEYFEVDMTTISLIITVKTAVMCLCSMISSSILKRFPARISCMCGGVIYVIGQLLTSFAPNVYVLFITYGVLSGISFNSCIMATNFIIQKHFDANRALGIGCSALGLCVGPMIGAPIITVFIRTYCWRGASLIMSALFSHIVAFGWFCKEPESVDDKKLKKSGHFQRRDKDGRAEVSGYENKAMIFDDLTGREVKMMEHCEEKVERSEPSSISENRNTEQTSPSNRSDDETRVDEYDNSEDKVKERSCVVLSVKTLGKHVETSKNKTDSQTIENEKEHRSTCARKRLLTEIKTFMLDIFDFSLLKKPYFILITFCSATTMGCNTTYLYHFPRKVITLGMSKDDVPSLMSTNSASIMVCRIVVTLSVNHSHVSKKVLYACGVLLVGAGCCLTVLHSFLGLAASCVIMGTGIGITNTVVFLLMVEISGIMKYPKAMAVNNIMLSIGQMTVAPVSGYFYDVTHNYDTPFVLMGSITILTGFILSCFTLIKYTRQSGYKLEEIKKVRHVYPDHISQVSVF